MTTKFLTGLAFASIAGLASAGVPTVINEIYASHTGTDDQEYVELAGVPGASLDGLLVCVVEGDGANAGTLDRAYDLTGLTIQADGFFVLGDTAVGLSFPGELDLDIGTSNTLENGTQTYYLLDATSVAAVTALLTTDVSTGPKTTSLPTLGTVLDIIAQRDGSDGDTTFDGAVLFGPDGSFGPAGGLRASATLWCYEFLDFDDVANLDLPRTPGSANVACTVSYANLGCPLDGTQEPNLVGTGTLIGGGAASLELTDAIAAGSTTLVLGGNTIFASFKGGTLVPAPDFLIALGDTDAAGEISLPFTWPTGIPAGVSIFMQAWVVDALAPKGLAASNGLQLIAN